MTPAAWTLHPIGAIRSPWKTKEQCPIQGAALQQALGSVELDPALEPGLTDIEGFSHLMLLYRFDRAGAIELVRPTFLDDRPPGIFASRHPCRPNGIGLSIVELVGREGTVLSVRGIDVLDATPLLDIKPYIPRFDLFPQASNGWVEDKGWRDKPVGRE